uniref:E3 ubiquitin-protein ligase n=1 Tax=Timema genevievae TaxID=629358 RepID=A0A7R9PJ43_TIMGE|nr:unnamed protein product [Timema genevievae]
MSKLSLYDFNDSILGILECPICMDSMCSPIYLCKNGHNICSECRQQVTKCSTCRDEFLTTRNIALENLAEKVLYSCDNADAGCSEKMLMIDFPDHNSKCPYRLYDCLQMGKDPCEWKGHRWDLLDHINKDHIMKLKVDENEPNILHWKKFNIDETCVFSQLLNLYGEIFWLHEKISAEEKRYYLAVQYIGIPEDSTNFTYKVEFTSKCGAYEVSFKSFTHNDGKFQFNVLALIHRELVHDQLVYARWAETTHKLSTETGEQHKSNMVNNTSHARWAEVTHKLSTETGEQRLEQSEQPPFPTASQTTKWSYGLRMELLELKHYEELIGMLECPVCFNLMSAPILQCDNGHIICAACKPRLPQCPTCRSEFLETRNKIAEGLAENLPHPCINSDEGCNEKVQLKKMAQHNSLCSFRIYDCIPCKNIGCTWQGRRLGIIPHMKEAHKGMAWMIWKNESLFYDNFDWSTDFVDVDVIDAHDNVFFYYFKRDAAKSCVFFSVQYVGPKEEASLYKYTIVLEAPDGHPRLEFSNYTHADIESFEASIDAGKCFNLGFDLMKLFVDPFNQFHFKLFVEKAINTRDIARNKLLTTIDCGDFVGTTAFEKSIISQRKDILYNPMSCLKRREFTPAVLKEQSHAVASLAYRRVVFIKCLTVVEDLAHIRNKVLPRFLSLDGAEVHWRLDDLAIRRKLLGVHWQKKGPSFIMGLKIFDMQIHGVSMQLPIDWSRSGSNHRHEKADWKGGGGQEWENAGYTPSRGKPARPGYNMKQAARKLETE